MSTSEPKKQDLERLAALKRSLRDDPRSLAFVTLAQEHNRLHQHAEAADVAQRGLLSHPDSVAGRLSLAVAEAERDNIREALEQIKRALIIDQENPSALALMGRILLKRGLAKRAVQFLSHAVKLEPKSKEYLELLREARRSARGEAPESPVPVFDPSGGAAEGEDNPWSSDGESDDPTTDGVAQSEHTVFDPDMLKQLGGNNRLRKPETGGRRLESLPEIGEYHEEEEPTAYLQTGPGGRLPSHSAPDPREEPTAFAAPNPLADAAPLRVGRKAQVGGSAADFSQMMKEPEVAQARAEAEARVRAAGPGSSSNKAPSGRGKAPSKPIQTPVEAPSVTKAREVASGAAPAAKGEDQTVPPDAVPVADAAVVQEVAVSSGPKKVAEPAKKPESAKAVEPAKKPEPAKSADSVPAHKKIGHVATRMVDDALWALYGKRAAKDAEEQAEEPAEDAPAKAAPSKAPVRAKLRAKPSAAPAPADNKGPMVVRTSAHFGRWMRAAAVLVVAVAAGFVGHWIALASAGPGPEVASEELKGVASDLERGGLASLLAAEDQIAVLSRSNPSLAPLLDGALAEIYARRWRSFGRDPDMRRQVAAKLQGLARTSATVEVIAAQTLVSTSAAGRKQLRAELKATRVEYPDSPKSFLIEGWSHDLDGKSAKALSAYYEGYRLHPQHRGTLLAIARWHADAGAYGAAFSFFDKLQEKYPDDVEVAIERYVLGKTSGADPAEAEAVSALAGLVREELPQVAKDEAGRAALAFSIPLFANGELSAGLRELEKAEAAFGRSPSFKRALGDAFLAIGDFDRAESQYANAQELGGDVKGAQIGVARARLGKAARFRVDLAEEGARIQAKVKDAKVAVAEAKLPFGTLSFVVGRFELLKLTVRSDIFPEDTYAALADQVSGADLQKALDAASYVALGEARGRKGNCKDAVRLFKKANKLAPSAGARFGQARCWMISKDYKRAEAALERALDQDPDHVPGWLMLGKARQAQGDVIGAIRALERFDNQDPVVPDALYVLGTAKLRRGDWEGALANLKGVTDHLPDHAPAQLALGEVLHQLGRSQAALAAHRAALEADPRLALRASRRPRALSPVQLLYLGRVLYERNHRRGIAMMKESLRFEGSPLEARLYLGKALLISRRTRKEGKRALEKFMRVAPEGPLRNEARRLLRRR